MLSPLNQLASGAENPCLTRSVTLAGTYFDIVAPEEQLPSWVLGEVTGGLGPGSFSLSSTTAPRFPSLSRTGSLIAKSTRSLSRKGTLVSRPWAMLSLSSHEQEGMKEGLRLEVQRVVDVVFRAVDGCRALSEDARKMSRVELSGRWTPSRADLFDRGCGKEPLPEAVVLVDVLSEVLVDGRA
jgi:hypothetical protein